MKWTLLICILLFGCATQQMPGGGEKDTVAPKPVYFIPENRTLNFSSDQIIIEFDEYFQMINPVKQVVISPPVYPEPDYVVNGKKLIIKFNSNLKPNTSYQLYFANAIKDVNEGNDTSFSYVFSTGNQIDKNIIKVFVKNAFTGKPVKDCWISAYQNSDSLFDIKKPDYIAKTNNNGYGELQFLPDNTFHVFALLDKNADLMYSSYDEEIAFLSSEISSRDSTLFTLKLFKGIDPELKLLKTIYKHPGKLSLLFNQSVSPDELNITTGEYEKKDNDTIVVFLPVQKIKKGTHELTLKRNDKTDTVRYYIPNELTKESHKLKINQNGLFDSNKGVEIFFPWPVDTVIKEKIHLYQDSLPLEFEITKKAGLILLKADFVPETKYRLIVENAAVKSKYLLESDSLNTIVSSYPNDFLCSFSFSISGPEGIIQILKNNTVFLEKQVNNNLIYFNQIIPGKYQVRYIVDDDHNNKWSTGDWSNRIQAETIYYFPEIIELRSGWDNELEWTIPNE